MLKMLIRWMSMLAGTLAVLFVYLYLVGIDEQCENFFPKFLTFFGGSSLLVLQLTVVLIISGLLSRRYGWGLYDGFAKTFCLGILYAGIYIPILFLSSNSWGIWGTQFFVIVFYPAVLSFLILCGIHQKTLSIVNSKAINNYNEISEGNR